MLQCNYFHQKIRIHDLVSHLFKTHLEVRALTQFPNSLAALLIQTFLLVPSSALFGFISSFPLFFCSEPRAKQFQGPGTQKGEFVGVE